MGRLRQTAHLCAPGAFIGSGPRLRDSRSSLRLMARPSHFLITKKRIARATITTSATISTTFPSVMFSPLKTFCAFPRPQLRDSRSSRRGYEKSARPLPALGISKSACSFFPVTVSILRQYACAVNLSRLPEEQFPPRKRTPPEANGPNHFGNALGNMPDQPEKTEL